MDPNTLKEATTETNFAVESGLILLLDYNQDRQFGLWRPDPPQLETLLTSSEPEAETREAEIIVELLGINT